MKLELKHLVSYLPYGLKIKDVKHGSVFEALNFITTPHQDFSLFKGNLDQLINDKYLKPILFPLSSLTKEIAVNGETFVPVKNLFELHHCGMRIKEKLQCFSFNKNKIKYDDFNCAITDGVYMFGYSNYGGFQAIDTDEYKNYTVINQLELLMKLFEWKIDVLGLIEAGLAEPVTEYFNPYK